MNYEFKGTPGPWASYYDDNGFYYIIKQTGGSPYPYISATGGDGDKDKDNSLLQSKAPEMFRMLKECLQCFEAFNTGSIMCDNIRQLLQKATEL